MTEKQAFGRVYHQLRAEKGHTLQDVADALARHGLDIETRGGVKRLEDRGSMELPVIRAYCRTYGITQAKMERQVREVMETELSPV